MILTICAMVLFVIAVMQIGGVLGIVLATGPDANINSPNFLSGLLFGESIGLIVALIALILVGGTQG